MSVYENLIKRKIINENEDGTVNRQTQEKQQKQNNAVQKTTLPTMSQEQAQKIANENSKNIANNILSQKTLWQEVQDFANDLGSLGKLTGLGVSSGFKNVLNYIETANENIYPGYKSMQKSMFMTNPRVSDSDKANIKAKDDIFVLNTIKNKNPELKNSIENEINTIKSNTKEIETNLAKKYYRDEILKDELEIQNTQSQLKSGIGKKLGEIAPSLGQMIPGTALSALNPSAGMAYFTTSAGGSYINDALQRGMTEEQAFKYGTIMGSLEGLSEQVITGQQLNKVKKAFTGKEIRKSLLESYGFNILENAVQEAIMEPAQELTAQIVGGEDKANWDNIWGRMFDSGLNGALMGVITNGVTYGLEKTGKAYDKIKNGQQLTENELNSVIEENVKVRGKDTVENEIKQGANKVFEQVTTIENKPINMQEQQITPSVQENVLNQNVVENKPQNDLKGRSFEDILDEAMSNYEYEEVKSPLQGRNINTIGKETKVNAYQYDNPEVKPYFQEMAQMLGEDIGNIASEDNRKTVKGGGTSLSTNIDAVKQLKDMGYSYNQIIDGIMDIIDDNGKENNALSKKIEIILDDQLRNGYVNSYGKYISPNEDYINLISKNNVQTKQELPTVKENFPVQESKQALNNLKQQQYNIIKETNSMLDDYHTGIRSENDIKTFDEVINDDESFVYGDFSKEDAEKALKDGKVTVYSSKPIEQGSFVSTSQNMAKDYAGNGKIYSQEVNLNDVAWINGDEGQYAKVDSFANNQEDSNKSSFNLPQKEEVNLPTKGEKINWNEMENSGGKIRKHYQSIIESSNTTAEAKAIAKEMMGLDTYTPQSNESLLQKADRRINMSNPNSELETLLGRAINNDKVSDVDIAVGERLIEYYSKIGDREHLQDAIHATALAGTQAGRTVQAMALLNHMTPQGQLVWLQRSIDKINDALQQKYKNRSNVPQFELTQEMTDKILNTDSKEEMYKALDEVYEELGQQVPKSISEKIDEWRYFSMLANVKTHARNIIGNTAMHITQRAKDKVAGVIEGAVAKFNPNMERTHTIVPASKEVKQFAKNDVKNMDVQTELGMNENKYNPQSRLQNSRRTFKSNTAEKTLGNLFNLNSKALEVEDNIGLRSMYVKALSEYLAANKIDVNNMTDAQLSKARQYAIKSAQEATFHQASSLATALNQMGKKNAITKFALDSAVPFKKTPINVAKTGVQYSPVGLIKSAVYDIGKLRKGQITVNQYIDNISRGLTGTGITYMGYVLAEAGILKASGGDDDKKERYDEEQGKQTYSLEIGGKSYSLDWLSPVGIPLFIGAEINEQANETKKEKTSISNDDDNDLQKIIKSVSNIVSASSNAINPMSEMSMLSGLTNILTSYNKENAVGDMIVNAGKSYVNQFVPTALGQLARTTDDYERSTKSTKTGTFEKAVDSTINQIKSKIPGLRETLPVKTDIWGKEVKQSENLPTRAFNNFVNPSIVKDVSTDKVDKELNKLYDETKESSILPSTIEKTFTINKQSYRMTNDEYSKYSKQYGETSYNLLNKLVSSSEYSKLTNQEKQKAIEKVYEYAKESNKIDYAKNNNIDIQDSTLYNTMKALKSTNGQSQYLNYLAKTTGMDKEVEKNEVLKNSNYDNATKSIIYENTIGKDDSVFNTVKSSIKIDQYLDYKIRTSNDEFKADKDENGKTISGSAKAKIFDYVENNITGYENQLVMLASKYKLSRDEQEAIVNYVNKTSKTNDEVIQKLEKMSNNFEIKNGKVYFK